MWRVVVCTWLSTLALASMSKLTISSLPSLAAMQSAGAMCCVPSASRRVVGRKASTSPPRATQLLTPATSSLTTSWKTC